MTIKRIKPEEWGDSTVLWRYMDVYGVLSLLTSNYLKFSSLSSFEDGLEGTMPFQNSAIKLIAPPGEEADSLNSAKEKNAQRARIEVQRTNVWVTSWQAMEHECALMWRVYGSRQNGVAIKTCAHKLLSTLDESYVYIAGPCVI